MSGFGIIWFSSLRTFVSQKVADQADYTPESSLPPILVCLCVCVFNPFVCVWTRTRSLNPICSPHNTHTDVLDLTNKKKITFLLSLYLSLFLNPMVIYIILGYYHTQYTFGSMLHRQSINSISFFPMINIEERCWRAQQQGDSGIIRAPDYIPLHVSYSLVPFTSSKQTGFVMDFENKIEIEKKKPTWQLRHFPHLDLDQVSINLYFFNLIDFKLDLFCVRRGGGWLVSNYSFSIISLFKW